MVQNVADRQSISDRPYAVFAGIGTVKRPCRQEGFSVDAKSPGHSGSAPEPATESLTVIFISGQAIRRAKEVSFCI